LEYRCFSGAKRVRDADDLEHIAKRLKIGEEDKNKEKTPGYIAMEIPPPQDSFNLVDAQFWTIQEIVLGKIEIGGFEATKLARGKDDWLFGGCPRSFP